LTGAARGMASLAPRNCSRSGGSHFSQMKEHLRKMELYNSPSQPLSRLVSNEVCHKVSYIASKNLTRSEKSSERAFFMLW
jgi:hypothetical protein